MAINIYKPHIVILPEDRANRQIANGFLVAIHSTQVKIENEIGGWLKVVDSFHTSYSNTMRLYANRYLIMIVDCDKTHDRISNIRANLPDDIIDRIFILGCISEPEKLKTARLGSYESIGRRIADECRSKSDEIWQHDLLKNNFEEIVRLRKTMCYLCMPH